MNCGWVGGWLGGIQVHNHDTFWPNLQESTWKYSSQVESHVGLEYGNNYIHDTVTIPSSVCGMAAPRNIRVNVHIL